MVGLMVDLWDYMFVVSVNLNVKDWSLVPQREVEHDRIEGGVDLKTTEYRFLIFLFIVSKASV